MGINKKKLDLFFALLIFFVFVVLPIVAFLLVATHLLLTE